MVKVMLCHVMLTKALGVSKLHGHGGILVKVIKICVDPTAHPLTMIGKKQKLFQFIKKMINSLFQITDLFLYYQYALKSLKIFFHEFFVFFCFFP